MAETVRVIIGVYADLIVCRQASHSVSVGRNLFLCFNWLVDRSGCGRIEEGTYGAIGASLIPYVYIVVGAVDLKAAVLGRSSDADIDDVDVLLYVAHCHCVVSENLPHFKHWMILLKDVRQAFALSPKLMIEDIHF